MKILRLAVLLANFLPLSLASEDETLYGLDSAVERYFASKTASPSPMYSPMAHSSAKGEHSHTNNWVVLVCTSRFWFNYRHIANTLSVYRTVKRLGIPDSNIILMLADDVACNPRNRYPATVFNNRDRKLDLYGGMLDEMRGVGTATVEVDFRGYEVTVENFIRLLTDRLDPDTPRSKRLLTDDRSNILVYMTGHGGDQFLKFQDAEEIGSQDLADAFQQMHVKKRYHEILFIVDTCQAATLYTQFYSPNILATGSSSKGQNSYSHWETSQQLGVAVIDRYTYYLLDFMERSVTSVQSKATIDDLFKSFQPHLLASDPGVREDLYQKSTASVLITDFFGNVPSVQLTNDPYDLTNAITVSDYFAERDEWDLKLPVFDGYKEHSDTTVELIKSDFESAVQQLNDRVMDLFNVVLARPDGSAGHEMISVKQVTDQDNIQLPPLQFVFGTFTLAMLLFTLSI